MRDRGYFKNREQLLDLHEDVILRSTSYVARLSEATVDMAKGTVVSDKPVNVKMADGTLDAQRLEITGRGELMIFYGGVTMHLRPSTSPPSLPPNDERVADDLAGCISPLAIAFALGGPAAAQAARVRRRTAQRRRR